MEYCGNKLIKRMAVLTLLLVCLNIGTIDAFANNIESQIEQAKDNEIVTRGYANRTSVNNNKFSIYGWGFIEGINSTDSMITILFEGIYHGNDYKASVERTKRTDLTNRFGEDTFDYDNSGYKLDEYDVSNFVPDLYTVGILIENGDMVGYEKLDFTFQIENELSIALDDILVEQDVKNYEIEQAYKNGEYSKETPYEMVNPYHRMQEATLHIYDTEDEETGKTVRVFEYENTEPLVFGNDEIGYHTITNRLMNDNFVLTSDIFTGNALYNDSFFEVDPAGRIVAEYVVENVKQVTELANGNFLALGRKPNSEGNEQALYEIERNTGTYLRIWDPTQKTMDEIVTLYEDEESPEEPYLIENLDSKTPRYGVLPEKNFDNIVKLPQYDKSLDLMHSNFTDNGLYLTVELELSAEEVSSEELFLYFVGEETYKYSLGTGNEITTYIDNWMFPDDWYEIYLVRGDQMTEILAEWANQPVPTREMEGRTVDIQVDNAEYGSYIEETFHYDGVETTLMATAKDGYEVKAWLEDGKWISQESTVSFEVEGDKQLELVIREQGSFYYPIKNMIEDFAFIVTAILLIIGASIHWYRKGEYNIKR